MECQIDLYKARLNQRMRTDAANQGAPLTPVEGTSNGATNRQQSYIKYC